MVKCMITHTFVEKVFIEAILFQVARTCGVLSPTSAEVHGGAAICSGYLWKLGGYASGVPSNKWIRRWFALKKDNCLYYYKTDTVSSINEYCNADNYVPFYGFVLSL